MRNWWCLSDWVGKGNIYLHREHRSRQSALFILVSYVLISFSPSRYKFPIFSVQFIFSLPWFAPSPWARICRQVPCLGAKHMPSRNFWVLHPVLDIVQGVGLIECSYLWNRGPMSAAVRHLATSEAWVSRKGDKPRTSQSRKVTEACPGKEGQRNPLS